MRVWFERFRKSIRGKILLYLGSAVVFMPVVLLVFFGFGQYQNLRQAHEELILENVQTAALAVERENYEAASVARTLAESQESGLFGRRQETVNYAKIVLLNEPTYVAAFFGYEPDADQNDAEYLQKPDAVRDAVDSSGRFVPAWIRDEQNPNILKLTPLLDLDSYLYYEEVKDTYWASGTETCILSEPYPREGRVTVEAVCPIAINQKFVGLAGVARQLHSFREHLLSLETPYREADFFLVSAKGRIVATTISNFSDLELKDAGVTPYGKELTRVINTKPEEKNLYLLRDPVLNEDCYYAGQPIPTGGWTMVLRVPQREILDPVWNNIYRATAIALVGVLLTFIGVLWIANSITRPISAAIGVAQQVASGDLTARVNVTSDGETGALLAAIAAMTQSLNTLVGKVQLSSEQLGKTTTEIALTARQQATTAREASSFTSGVVTAAAEISATSQEFAQIMGDVAEVVTESASMADAGRSGLGSMEDTLQHLLGANNDIVAKFTVLSKQASEISSVVTTITKVADQTNILSLNASIEAEKAGEYGRGFAVVAREIRRLADQTAVATLDIEKMVKEVQAAVSSGVEGLQALTTQVRDSYTEIGKISIQLGQIIERVQTLGPRFATLNQGIQDQSRNARRVSDSIGQLQAIARQIAETLHKTNDDIELLDGATQALRKEVSRFTVSTAS